MAGTRRQTAGLSRHFIEKLASSKSAPKLLTDPNLPPGAQDQLQALHDNLGSEDPIERQGALWYLDDVQGEAAVSIVRIALDDPDPDVRVTAIEELPSAADDLPVELVEKALRDSDPEVRLAALGVISQADEEKRFEPLVRSVANDPDEDVRDEAETLLEIDFSD